ncbi:asparaginase [Pontibaca salina]|uniref:Asparaginase n=1 Tax=Pontibaca salina TaxID=2795731 RepID=A0A934M159_9RHOB|nr:asparaginase [Pontibaca salina]MBI6630700.1 asparaginase [Pontibaca salina]
MNRPEPLAEIWRGPLLESVHAGHAVICDAKGEVVRAWGDPQAVIYPRSSAKMIQALPLLTSGAADKFGLTDEQLALACASHTGAAIHTDRALAWLNQLELTDDDLRCGLQMPSDKTASRDLICADSSPCQIHNNCSGKHCGFLTLNAHMQAGPDYEKIDHPVQQACLAAFEEVTDQTSPGYGIDGCSAPNFATTMHGLARAMAFFASARDGGSRMATAAQRLTAAMMAHPELVAGEGRACTGLMRAMDGKVAVKMGAEGVFIAIVPELQLGVAVKIADGANRGAECAIAAILVGLGVLDASHPAAQEFMTPVLRSWRGIEAGAMRPASGLLTRTG